MAVLKAACTDRRVISFSDEPIGTGAEKVVFFSEDREMAVCFYLDRMSDRAERVQRLNRLVQEGATTKGSDPESWEKSFRWPIAIIDGAKSIPEDFCTTHQLCQPVLAVVTPAYEGHYFFQDRTGHMREKISKWFTSEKARRYLPPEVLGTPLGYFQVCGNLARAVQHLHARGFFHSDLSSRNLLLDPSLGTVCIVDIDSVVVPGVGRPSVLGTPGYIAPEVIAGRTLPNIQTDRHSLAVLIYEILLRRHPLWGTKVNSTTSAEEDEKLTMGEKALFVEHPTDRSNWLDPQPEIPLARLGSRLQNLFYQAFVAGLHHPEKRPTAAEWETAIWATVDALQMSADGRNWTVRSS